MGVLGSRFCDAFVARIVILPRWVRVVYCVRSSPASKRSQLRVTRTNESMPTSVEDSQPTTIIPFRRVAEEGQRLRETVAPHLTLLRGRKSGAPLAARRFL